MVQSKSLKMSVQQDERSITSIPIRFLSMRRPERYRYVGAILIALAALVYAVRPASLDMHSWKALSIPIRIDVEHFLTPDFTTDLDCWIQNTGC